MTTNNPTILTYVEDAGAANYLTGVLPLLNQSGNRVHTFAAATGLARLVAEGIRVKEVGEQQDDAATLIDSVRPTIIVVGTAENTESFGLKLVEVGRRKGITTVGLIDGSANAAWRFAGTTVNPLAFAPDWVLVPDELVRQEYVSMGLNKDRVVAVGHPHYDQVRLAETKLVAKDQTELKKRLFPNAGIRPVLTFLAEISTGLDPAQYLKNSAYSLLGRGVSKRRTDVVIEELLDSLDLLDIPFHRVLRLHPKNTLDEFSSFLVSFDQVSSSESAWEIVYASDIVVGMSSHLLIESAILRRQTLSILPRASEQEWLPTIAAGITPCALTREALHQYMQAWPERIGMEPEASVLENFFRFGATERVAEFISSLAIKLNPVVITSGREH